MARYLSRAELSCIAGKYIEMYYALFGISKNDPAPINPEQFANSVLGLNLKMPTEQSTINGALKQLIEENDLPKVVFHSFRHSSITYKLKLNGGDIKAVQGDSGHAQASMVTEQYAHILDDDRRLNAQRFDDFFYQHHGAEPEALPRAEQSAPKASPVDADAAAALAKLLADPSMATLIKNLAKNL